MAVSVNPSSIITTLGKSKGNLIFSKQPFKLYEQPLKYPYYFPSTVAEYTEIETGTVSRQSVPTAGISSVWIRWREISLSRMPPHGLHWREKLTRLYKSNTSHFT